MVERLLRYSNIKAVFGTFSDCLDVFDQITAATDVAGSIKPPVINFGEKSKRVDNPWRRSLGNPVVPSSADVKGANLVHSISRQMLTTTPSN